MKNIDVIRCFLSGRKAVSHTSNLSTDGRVLYSYDLAIAHLSDSDCGRYWEPIVYDFTAPAGFFESVTTSSHVNAVKRELEGCDFTIMRPDLARHAGLIIGGE